MADTVRNPFIWFEIMTDDLEKAMAFYKGVVGWQVRDSGMPGMPYMIFGKDGKDTGGMMSWRSMGSSQPPRIMGHIFTPDVEKEAAAVVADGGRLHRPVQGIPEVGRFAVVSDPQGADYLLFQPNPTEVPPARLKPMEPGAVGWCELGTTDWESAWTFYSKHYGWTKHMAVDMGPMGTYQTFMMTDTEGGGMMTVPAERLPKGPAWLFYFTVEDIQAAAQRVKDSGGTITHGPAEVPGGAWVLQGTDDQGCRFALTAKK